MNCPALLLTYAANEMRLKNNTNMRGKGINDYVRDDKDTGCEFAPSCLNCPFPECMKDNPIQCQAFREQKKACQIIAMHQKGKSTKTIATELSISLRTVQRALAKKVT